MSVDHTGGNLLNQIALEEHDGNLNAHRVVSAATIYAVVNTGSAGVGQSIVTVANPISIAGNITLDAGSRTGILGNVTLSDSKTFIGLTTTVIGNSTSQPVPVQPPLSGYLNVSIDQTGANNDVNVIGNITLSDPKGFIGLVTIGGGTLGTSFSGNVTLDAGSKTQIVGNVTLSDPKGFIGLVTIGGGTLGTSFSGNITLDPGSRTGIVGNVTLSDSKTFIGLVTVGNVVSTTLSGNVTLDAGSKTGIVGNITISDSKGFIGLTTVVQASAARTITGNVTLSDSKTFIGLVTVVQSSAVRSIAGNITITSGTISVLHAGAGNVTLSDSKTFIGLVTVVQSSAARTIAGNVTLSDSKTFIGLVTVVQSSAARTITGNVTLSDSKTFIGLVTAVSLNAGTTKTIDWKPITLSTASILTVFTPTNANKFYITNLLVSSDATVRVSIKSGVTYLTGNASIGVVLNPGGGWVERGTADAPSFIGCASGPLIVEKFDMTGTKANVGGKIIYYSE